MEMGSHAISQLRYCGSLAVLLSGLIWEWDHSQYALWSIVSISVSHKGRMNSDE